MHSAWTLHASWTRLLLREKKFSIGSMYWSKRSQRLVALDLPVRVQWKLWNCQYPFSCKRLYQNLIWTFKILFDISWSSESATKLNQQTQLQLKPLFGRHRLICTIVSVFPWDLNLEGQVPASVAFWQEQRAVWHQTLANRILVIWAIISKCKNLLRQTACRTRCLISSFPCTWVCPAIDRLCQPWKVRPGC